MRVTLPYADIKALHFSNGGGVYLATRRSNAPDDTQPKVVLKEARPWAGLDSRMTDAVERLAVEERFLRRLAGTKGIPQLVRAFSSWEHIFLEIEYIDGIPLSRWRASNHPDLMYCPDPDTNQGRRLEYWRIVERVAVQLRKILGSIAGAGYTYNDLHSGNVIVTSDLTVYLVDFEVVSEHPRSRAALGHPAYANVANTGVLTDLQRLDYLTLSLLAPELETAELTAREIGRSLAYITTNYPWATKLADAVLGGAWKGQRAVEVRSQEDFPMSGAVRSHQLIAKVLESAQIERSSRLYPGDPRQFSDLGALAFEYGCAGVTWASRELGASVPDEQADWFIEGVRGISKNVNVRSGLLDGLAGIALGLAGLGEVGLARGLVERVAESCHSYRNWVGASMRSGFAGIAIALCEFEKRYGLGSARQALAEIESELGDWVEAQQAKAPEQLGSCSGLVRGLSGVALALCCTYDITGQESALVAAERALRLELRGAVVSDDGSVSLRDGRRTLPYFGTGSAGHVVAIRELCLRGNTAMVGSLGGWVRACSSPLVAQPQLMNGRAGIAMSLLLLDASFCPEPVREMSVSWGRRHAAMLRDEFVTLHGASGFRGEGLHRLSMDFSTGTAGVAMALGVADGLPVSPFPGVSPAGPDGTNG
jgi:hypothetical protein